MRFVISTVSVKWDQMGWLTEEAHFLGSHYDPQKDCSYGELRILELLLILVLENAG